MPRTKQPERRFRIKLTLAQRKAIAELAPSVIERLKLDELDQRIVELTLTELREVKEKAERAMQARKGYERRPLRHILEATSQAITQSQGEATIPPWEQVFQIKITLLDSRPPIWRRIQVKDCTLDKLHEHIQTVMGWTNSHLHHFRINGQLYGDPDLMQENFEEMQYKDSTCTKLTDILPSSSKRFRFQYEYDFGDSWEHEILFEGVSQAEFRRKYPQCLNGARACPPEDVGGVWGYVDFVETIERWGWIGQRFDPEAFRADTATRRMRHGLPKWRP